MKTTTADDGMNEGEDPATNENRKVRKWLATSDNELGDNIRGATRAQKKKKGNGDDVIGLTMPGSDKMAPVQQIPNVPIVDFIKEQATKKNKQGASSAHSGKAVRRGVEAGMDMEDELALTTNAPKPITQLKIKASQKVSESKSQW